MTKHLFLACAACLALAAPAFAMDESERSLQMQAYEAYMKEHGGATGASVPVTVPAVPAPAPVVDAAAAPDDAYVVPAGATTTLERTTTKTYTVTRRKVGKVGNRLYPSTSETVDGGVTVERFVNGVEKEREVVKSDPLAGGVPQEETADYIFREYYTTEKDVAEKSKDMPADVKVYYTGSFND